MTDVTHRASRLSIVVGFLGLGLFMGMWGVLVPARSADLGLNELLIAGFLLIVGLSLCAAIFLVTRFQAFQDPHRLLRLAGPFYAIGFASCLTTGSVGMFFLSGIVAGLAAGFVDTALNSQSSQWEQATGKRAMSFFHALFSLGLLAGAGLVSLLLSARPSSLTFGILACAALYAAFMAMRREWVTIDQTEDLSPDKQPAGFRLPVAVGLFLGLSILLATLTEGGIIDWSALHLHRSLGVSLQDAGRPVLWFGVAMTASRFAGDRLIALIPAHLLLAVPLSIAAALMTVAIVTANVPLLMAGYVAMGLAVGNAFPIIISIAGRAAGEQPLREISIIVGFAYVGLISGPALFGVTAHFFGLDRTMIVLAAVALSLGLACFAMPRFAAARN